ncbi:MAG TPA: hypothetical protein VGN81_18785 [Pseudonocardiaceae bacterium]
MLDVNKIPGWLLWFGALATMLIFFAAILRIVPPTKKFVVARGLLLVGVLVFVFPVASDERAHVILFFAALIFLPASIPLFWYGLMPTDMPLANEPGARNHPRYREFARRGRIVGYLIVGWIVAVIVLGALFVQVD